TGDGPIEARMLVLATGLRDELPDIPGLHETWGREVAACPFCHGHELAGRVIGLVGEGPHLPVMVAMLSRIGSEVVTFAQAPTRIERIDGGLRLHLAAGGTSEVAGLFMHPPFVQSAPFAHQLGLELLPSGCVRIDALGQTSHPRVFAGGDLAHVAELPMPMASVLGSAAAGLTAGASAVRVLAAGEVAGPR